MLPPFTLEHSIDRIVREEWGRILASITKSCGDLQLAEDSLQDAVEAALIGWQEKGLPKSPAAWLITTARRKTIDRLRRRQSFVKKQAEISYLADLESQFQESDTPMEIPDKRLELIFTCCHPSLADKTKVALTLRTVGGLTTDEIAKAFLDKPQTIAQRLVRAKKKIKLAGIAYEVPGKDQLSGRLKHVLSTIYLVFNEGYAASSGENLTRVDLIVEAIRIARITAHLMPDEAEVSGLLALMLLHDSRRFARLDAGGRMVPLEKQNRAKWDSHKIAEGTTLLHETLSRQKLGPYQIQACISALHVEAPSWEQTDWPQIAALYNLLYRVQPSPVIRINQALAISYAESIEAALKILDDVSNHTNIMQYKSYYVARADLMARAGQAGEAKKLLEQAINLSGNDVERDFLLDKAKNIEKPRQNKPKI